ncbi:hypothetical protein K7X08_019906 [Anisodus acutangulus]|uniref:Isopropylmalate dehydrogenase-like domain-containing protein n=1 Tax=Anisodus acutangulus TaxID=402998 RepID=A0A9Q1MSS9_9SOLA|nr:hypothetical protein K7X08_019906 [Anisodus acutangulus]
MKKPKRFNIHGMALIMQFFELEMLAMMLTHLEFPSLADRLETAVKRVIAEGKFRRKDIGGDSTIQEVVDAIIAAVD